MILGMAKQINSVVIGCGRIGSEFEATLDTLKPHSHAGAYVACTRSNLICGVDTDASKKELFENAWGVPCFSTLSEVPTPEEVGCVSICTPSETHLTIIRKIILTFPNIQVVWCEKPMGSSVSELQCIHDLSIQYGFEICVNAWRRWDPIHQEITRHLQGGSVGKIQTITAQAHVGLVNTGYHLFDLLDQYMDSRPAKIQGKLIPDGSCDPGAIGIIHYENDVIAFIDMIWRQNQRFGMTIQGDKGRIECYSSGVLLNEFKMTTDHTKIVLRESSSSPLLVAVSNICDHIEKGADLLGHPKNAMAVMNLIAGFYHSDETGDAVDFPVHSSYFNKVFKSRLTSLSRDGSLE